jgi:hypothetical protein
MLPSPVVFYHGQPLAPSSPTSHYSSDPFTLSTLTRNQENPAATAICLWLTTRVHLPNWPSAVSTNAMYKSFIPPPTNKQCVKLHSPVLYQWLPPPCQVSCFSSVGTFLVFPGTSIVLPSPLLEKRLPYMSTIACAAPSSCHHPPPTALSLSNISHLVGSMFNGTLLGYVLSLPIPKPLAPMPAHHLPSTTTFPPTPEAVFQDDAKTPSPLPQYSTIKAHALPHWLMGSILYGQEVIYFTVML